MGRGSKIRDGAAGERIVGTRVVDLHRREVISICVRIGYGAASVTYVWVVDTGVIVIVSSREGYCRLRCATATSADLQLYTHGIKFRTTERVTQMKGDDLSTTMNKAQAYESILRYLMSHKIATWSKVLRQSHVVGLVIGWRNVLLMTRINVLGQSQDVQAISA